MDKDNFGKNNNKIIWENTAIIHSVLRKKNYKAKLLISSILKKNTKKKKKLCWKHYSNSYCFVIKATVLPHMI